MKKEDMITKFFYRSIKSHTARNKILRLQDKNGNMIGDHEKVKDTTLDFFSSSLNLTLALPTRKIGLEDQFLWSNALLWKLMLHIKE